MRTIDGGELQALLPMGAAIEALESKKAAIEVEIAALRQGLRPRRRRRGRATAKAGKRPHISAAGRKALSERMTARWAEWRAERARKAAKARKPAGRAKSKPRRSKRPSPRKRKKS